MTVITLDQASQYATQAGFQGESLTTILAIAQAESGLDTWAENCGNAGGSCDRGILQINNFWHSEVSDTCCRDALCSFQSGYRISMNGTDFTRWSTYNNGQYLKFMPGGQPMPEVATFPEPVNQFEGGESVEECVAFGCADINYCGRPGSPATGSGEDVDQLADRYYILETGSITSDSGLSTTQEYDILQRMGLHYTILPIDANSNHDSDIASVKQSLAMGLPVLICGAETGFYDIGLGDVVPYAWPPSGNHCIVATGIAPSGNLLVRDYASIHTSLFTPGSVREYDNSKMFLISGTAVTPHWFGESMVPKGYTDDGKTLTAANGFKVVLGFRDFVMNYPGGWNGGQPMQNQVHMASLEVSNPRIGPGDSQIFQNKRLEYTDHVFEGWLGQELFVVQQVDASEEAGEVLFSTTQVVAALTTLQTEIAGVISLVQGTPPTH